MTALMLDPDEPDEIDRYPLATLAGTPSDAALAGRRGQPAGQTRIEQLDQFHQDEGEDDDQQQDPEDARRVEAAPGVDRHRADADRDDEHLAVDDALDGARNPQPHAG